MWGVWHPAEVNVCFFLFWLWSSHSPFTLTSPSKKIKQYVYVICLGLRETGQSYLLILAEARRSDVLAISTTNDRVKWAALTYPEVQTSSVKLPAFKEIWSFTKLQFLCSCSLFLGTNCDACKATPTLQHLIFSLGAVQLDVPFFFAQLRREEEGDQNNWRVSVKRRRQKFPYTSLK